MGTQLNETTLNQLNVIKNKYDELSTHLIDYNNSEVEDKDKNKKKLRILLLICKTFYQNF